MPLEGACLDQSDVEFVAFAGNVMTKALDLYPEQVPYARGGLVDVHPRHSLTVSGLRWALGGEAV